MIQPSHPHLVHRANLPSQALVAHFRAVVPHPSAAQAHPAAHHVQARLVRVLPLVLHLAAAHFQVPLALSHLRVHASHPLAPALHLVIQPLAQAAPALLSQALALRAAAVPLVAPALHLSAVLPHPVIPPSHLPVALAAHLVALHLHLRVKVSKSYREYISIQKPMKAALPLLLWDLEAVWQIEWIMA